MSEQTLWNRMAPYVIVLAITFGVGALAFTTIYMTAGLQSSAGSIGEVSASGDFQAGTWFRYEPENYYGADTSKIYIVANITGWVWSDDPTGGDYAIDAVLGKHVRVPTWDIRAFWYTSGMEAVELYGYSNGSSGISLWDEIARFFYVANQPSWRLADWTKDQVISGASSTYGLAKFYFPNWAYGWTSYDGKTLVWEHWNDDLEMRNEKDTNMLVRVVGLGSYETGNYCAMKLTSWSIKTDMAVQTDDVWEIDFDLSRVNNGALFTVNLLSDRMNFWNIDIASNDTWYLNNTSLKNYGGSTYNLLVAGYPLLVNISVQGVSLMNDMIVTDWVNKTFTITTSDVKNGAKLDDVVISNIANISANTLKIEWSVVDHADSYSVYMNQTFVGFTTDDFFIYHVPAFSADYNFTVIADTSQSGYITVNFTEASWYLFSHDVPTEARSISLNYGDEKNIGIAYTPSTLPDVTSWLWIAVVAGAAVAMLFVWAYLRCKQAPNSKTACKISNAIAPKRKS